jgi:adenosylcobinamide kinase/adenosylcobinamide-phosphate guanylyltransferase
MASLSLILGGARSGKSRYALEEALRGERVLFVATAQAFDDDMRSRIERHKGERPAHWTTVEAPLQVAQAVEAALTNHDTVVIDCLTLLATNALLTLPESCTQAESDAVILAEVEALLAVQARSTARWLVVSNEVGMGIVPPSHLGRLFQDSLGRANQRVALAADSVVLMVAGLPWELKPRIL